MRGFLGVTALIIGTIFLSFRSICLLFIKKKYLILTVYAVLFFGYPLFLYLMFNTEIFVFIREIPEWLLYIFLSIIAFGAPAWILSGFIINKIIEDMED